MSNGGSPTELAHLSLEELVQFRARVERLLEQKLRAEKKAVLAKLQLIEQYENKTSRSQTIDQQGISKKHRAKAAPKYRNPITGETWAGRGVLPRWMRLAVETGKKKEDFKI